MFGWLRKKVPAQSADSEPEPVEFQFEPENPVPPAPAQVDTPRIVTLPPLASNIPAAPPSADEDWAAHLETPPGAVKTPPTRESSGKLSPPPAVVPSAVVPSAGTDGPPDLLVPGTIMRAIPEKQPSTPRGWNVKVIRADAEGIWVARLPSEPDPLPVSPKEVLSLVVFDERKQVSYDCPVIRVKAGNPELVLVGHPLTSHSEKSKLDSVGGRQHFRIETQLPVEIKIPGLAGKGIPPLQGHTRDISKGGVSLTLTRPFDEGRELDLRVLSWNFPLQIRVKVTRCEEEANGKFTVSIAFPENMSSITRDLVGHFIMENQRGK